MTNFHSLTLLENRRELVRPELKLPINRRLDAFDANLVFGAADQNAIRSLGFVAILKDFSAIGNVHANSKLPRSKSFDLWAGWSSCVLSGNFGLALPFSEHSAENRLLKKLYHLNDASDVGGRQLKLKLKACREELD